MEKGSSCSEIELLDLFLQCLTLCETQEYVQIHIPLPQLREKLKAFWYELGPESGDKTDTLTPGHISPAQSVCDSSESGVSGDSNESGVSGDTSESGVSGDNGEGLTEGTAAGREKQREEKSEDEVEVSSQVDEGEGEGVFWGVPAVLDWEILTPDTSCLSHTPQISGVDREFVGSPASNSTQQTATGAGSSVPNSVGTVTATTGEEDFVRSSPESVGSELRMSHVTSANKRPPQTNSAESASPPSPSDRDQDPTSSSVESQQSLRPSEDTHSSASVSTGHFDLQYTAPRWSGVGSDDFSLETPPQPNFDDLSLSGASEDDVGRSVRLPPHSAPQTPITVATHLSVYYTAPAVPVSSAHHQTHTVTQTAAAGSSALHHTPHSLSSPHHTSPSPSRLSLSTYHTASQPSVTPSHHSLSSSPLTLPSPTYSSPHTLSSPSHLSPHTLSSPSPSSPHTPHSLNDSSTPSHISLSPSSPTHTQASPTEGDCSSVIVIESSDDEEADTKLENLFASMRLQSEKKKTTLEERERVCAVGGGVSSWLSGSPDYSMTAPVPRAGRRHHLTERNCRPVGETELKVQAIATPSAHKTFSRNKKAMAEELYHLFNHTVFDDQLPPDMDQLWNAKLRTTAGYCRNSGSVSSRHAQIELSTKVIDSYERLKNTLIHEMCHAAVWLINGIKSGGHGRHWRAWAAKANTVHPDLEPITRCHSYDISYKFHYMCTRCDYKLGRHSKSVNLTEARCPYCLSCLRLDETSATAGKKLNRFALFVKENYSDVKLQTPVGGHKVVMEKLREQYYKSCGRTHPINLED